MFIPSVVLRVSAIWSAVAPTNAAIFSRTCSSSGDALASFLLGYPVAGSVQVANPGLYYVNYYAGYAQDDLRLNDKLTLTFGVRYEFDSGLRERDDHLVVGFDPAAVFPVQAGGLNLKGGLVYAGQNGFPDYQGNPVKNQIARCRTPGRTNYTYSSLKDNQFGEANFYAARPWPGGTRAASRST
jgi:hypothetical protein